MTLVVLVALAGVVRGASGALFDARARRIVPGERVSDVELRFGRSHAYDVEGLDGRSAYEVKVSYRATDAARMEIDVERVGEGWWTKIARAGGGAPRRALLSVDKAILSARTLGNGATRARVTVRAEREGVYWAGEASAPKTLLYTIEVQRLFASGRFGEVPEMAIPMICLCVAFVALSIAISGPVSKKFVWKMYDDLHAA